MFKVKRNYLNYNNRQHTVISFSYVIMCKVPFLLNIQYGSTLKLRKISLNFIISLNVIKCNILKFNM